jgi:predicted nuclease with TOPRIM domain
MKIEKLGKLKDDLIRYCDEQNKINKNLSEFIEKNRSDITALNRRVDELKEENRRLREDKIPVKEFMGSSKLHPVFQGICDDFNGLSEHRGGE